MIIPIIAAGLFLIAVIVLVVCQLKLSKKKDILLKQEQLQSKYDLLEGKFNQLVDNYNAKALKLETIEYQINDKEQDIKALKSVHEEKVNEINNINNKINQLRTQADNFYNQQKEIMKQRLEDFKKTTEMAANIYVDNIEKVYEDAEAAHARKMARLQEEFNGAAADLDKLKETRKAAHEALLKQQEIKSNKDNYRLLPSSFDLEDIHSLQHIKQGLHKPRILSMLIWQTYFQPIAKEKFPVILQDKTKMGIYKITNLTTNQCYIGQSVDIYKRWSDHCKAGLGIDTPPGNKLYKSIQQYGLQNFTFELLCECSKEELDEKEKYFIELYQANLYGYNNTKGNK